MLLKEETDFYRSRQPPFICSALFGVLMLLVRINSPAIVQDKLHCDWSDYHWAGGPKKGRFWYCGVFLHHPPAENNGQTLNRAGKRTRRPERVFCVAAGSCVLDCGAICFACSGGARAVAVWPSVSPVMEAGLTLSVDTVTGRPFMGIRIVFSVRARTL